MRVPCVGVANLWLLCHLRGGVLCAGPEMGMWLAGFLISVVFSFLAALGINLQKHSMRMDEQQGMNRPAVRQPMWVTGFLLIFLGSILDFVAFGLAPQVRGAAVARTARCDAC